jgi:hypothetical protein
VGRPLSAVRVSALGEQILVKDDDTVWDPNSGQLQIDFDVADVADAVSIETADDAPDIAKVSAEAEGDVTTISERAAPAHRILAVGPSRDRMSADDWFNTALDLESVAADLAVAHFNLSRRFEAEGQRPDALRHLAEYKRLIESGGLGA